MHLEVSTEPEEIWKDIPGYNGLFQASTHGRIRGGKHKKAFKNLWKDLETSYVSVRLHPGNYKGITCYVHRLVAQTFLPNPNNLRVVNHKDRNRANNHVNNLEWITQSDNVKHSRANRRKRVWYYEI